MYGSVVGHCLVEDHRILPVDFSCDEVVFLPGVENSGSVAALNQYYISEPTKMALKVLATGPAANLC